MTGVRKMTDVRPSELTREEQLEIDLAESRARESQLAESIARRAVLDTAQELAETRQRIVDAVLVRRQRASAASEPAG